MRYSEKIAVFIVLLFGAIAVAEPGIPPALTDSLARARSAIESLDDHSALVETTQHGALRSGHRNAADPPSTRLSYVSVDPPRTVTGRYRLSVLPEGTRLQVTPLAVSEADRRWRFSSPTDLFVTSTLRIEVDSSTGKIRRAQQIEVLDGELRDGIVSGQELILHRPFLDRHIFSPPVVPALWNPADFVLSVTEGAENHVPPFASATHLGDIVWTCELKSSKYRVRGINGIPQDAVVRKVFRLSKAHDFLPISILIFDLRGVCESRWSFTWNRTHNDKNGDGKKWELATARREAFATDSDGGTPLLLKTMTARLTSRYPISQAEGFSVIAPSLTPEIVVLPPESVTMKQMAAATSPPPKKSPNYVMIFIGVTIATVVAMMGLRKTDQRGAA